LIGSADAELPSFGRLDAGPISDDGRPAVLEDEALARSAGFDALDEVNLARLAGFDGEPNALNERLSRLALPPFPLVGFAFAVVGPLVLDATVGVLTIEDVGERGVVF
jgi:hypothetical protein